MIVKGLKRQKVKTFEEAIYLMNFGEEHRMYRETNFHEHSSRSHTIYQVVKIIYLVEYSLLRALTKTKTKNDIDILVW